MKKLNHFYREVLKTLNNFRLTAFIIFVSNAVAGLVALGLIFCSYYAGDVWETTDARITSFMQLGYEQGEVYGKIMGMFFFLVTVIVIGLSIASAYNALPAVKNKDKIVPKRSLLLFAFVNGCFQLPLLVFSILAITLEKPNTLAAYAVTIPLTIITMLINVLLMVPFFKCDFYQPSVGSKLFVRKAKAEEEAKAE